MHRHSNERFDLRLWLAVAARRSLGFFLLAGSILVSSCQALHGVDSELMPFNLDFFTSQSSDHLLNDQLFDDQLFDDQLFDDQLSHKQSSNNRLRYNRLSNLRLTNDLSFNDPLFNGQFSDDQLFDDRISNDLFHQDSLHRAFTSNISIAHHLSRDMSVPSCNDLISETVDGT